MAKAPTRVLPTGPSNQDAPHIGNQFEEDSFFQRVLLRLLPPAAWNPIASDLRSFGERVVGDCLAHAKNVEDHRPTLRPYDAWGGRVDEIQTHPSWTALHDIAAAEGLIAIPYEMRHGAASRVHQMSKLYLFNASSGLYSCPLAMTDGAAKFLQVHQRQHQQRSSPPSSAPQLTQAYDHLTSRIPREFWTSGQWMTEKNGGSDVAAGCTTIARRQPDGTYRLFGFKWFTSATDSDMAITLARIVDDADGTVGAGSAGLSCFFLHVRDPRTRALNRIAIARLKDKLGTKQLPTAELELQGSEATLVSAPGRGVAAISTMVNVTRLWNAVSSVANARRMLALCRDYAHRRTVFGSALAANPLHLETLANMEVANRASLLFVLDAAAMLGRIEHAEAAQASASSSSSSPASAPASASTSSSSATASAPTSSAGAALSVAEENALLRLLTPALKLYTAKEAVRVVTEGVESFGGAGYVEDTRLPVILRDTHVLPIWEGTTNVLAHDVLRVLHGTKGRAMQPFAKSIAARLAASVPSPDALQRLHASLTRTFADSATSIRSALVQLLAATSHLFEAGGSAAAGANQKQKQEQLRAVTESRARALAYSLARVHCSALLYEQAAHSVNARCQWLSAGSVLAGDSASASAASGALSDVAALRRYLLGVGANESVVAPAATALPSTSGLVSPLLLDLELELGSSHTPKIALGPPSRLEENRLLALDIDECSGRARGCGDAHASSGKPRAKY